MSGQRHHPHVTDAAFTPQRPHPSSPIPIDIDEQVDSLIFHSPNPQITLRDIDIARGIPRAPSPPPLRIPAPTMENMTQDEKIAHLTEIAAKQMKMMEEANAFSQNTLAQLQESRRQLEASQQSVIDLTSAFQQLSSQPRHIPLTTTTAPKKKPELPPFDAKNVLVWIRRVEAAYARVGVVAPHDKFAWMESIFQVKLDPQIDSFLYTNNNTEQNWTDFIAYLKLQYGPTMRQKTQKLMGEIPRHDLKPSQYLVQLVEDTKDVKIDDIRREHLLKSIPPRIREIMGKEVETMTAEDVAKTADTFFDRHGKPLEKSVTPVNHVTSYSTASAPLPPPSSSSNASSASFTAAFSDDETDVNFVRKGNFRGNDRSRSRPRGQRSQSRPGFNRNPNASSTGGGSNDAKTSFPPGTCRWHRLFGEKSRKCVTDCPRFKSFSASQQSGNGQGGRRQ